MGYTLNRCQPVRADLLHRHPRRRRHRGDREHRPPLGMATAAAAAGRDRGGGRGRQPDHRRDPDRGRGAAADAVRLGLMGPYMSPIPANASAAMIFSFFVAVMVTPWLMVKIGRRNAPMAGHAHGAPTAARSAAPTPPSPADPGLQAARAWPSCSSSAVLTFGSLALFYTGTSRSSCCPSTTSPSSGRDRPARGRLGRGDRPRRAGGGAVARPARVSSRVQTHAGTAAPFNFNGLVRHYYLRAGRAAAGRRADQPRPSTSATAEPRHRARPARAAQGADLPEGTSLKVVEPPPGPPVMATLLAEIYGPDAETRRATARRCARPSRACPSSSMSTTASAPRAAAARDDLDPTISSSSGSSRRRVRHDRAS
jgi:hypothetical protein